MRMMEGKGVNQDRRVKGDEDGKGVTYERRESEIKWDKGVNGGIKGDKWVIRKGNNTIRTVNSVWWDR